ncbi:MAG TPA: YkvA family protein, partial [Thermoanaerobaculia bacterium]|nr:YkvA family protein [Thermoanaerobaculia bacterium]
RAGRLGQRTVEVLLLVPDMFILLVRLLLDPEVPKSSKTLIGGALAYFILPADLLPEALLGVGGYVDDVVLAAAVLSHALGEQLEPYARKYWSGSQDLRATLTDLTRSAEALLGENLYARLKGLLARRGVALATPGGDEYDAEAPDEDAEDFDEDEDEDEEDDEYEDLEDDPLEDFEEDEEDAEDAEEDLDEDRYGV